MRVQSIIKNLWYNLDSEILFNIVCRFRNINPMVFVYHRFCSAMNEEKYDVVSRETFEWEIKQINKYYKIITFGEYIDSRKNNQSIDRNTAIITIDDGYHDFYEYAYPKLKENKVGATLFVTTNFVDNNGWLWPDILEYCLKNTTSIKFEFKFQNKKFYCDLTNNKSRNQTWQTLTDYCIKINDIKKWAFIEQLIKELTMEIPKKPPKKYSAVTWKQIKEMSNNGIEIGSHTLNHPILSKINNKQLYNEIALSKKILEIKTNQNINSFCYPNSQPDDINNEVVKQVKSAGYKGAVFGGPKNQNFENLYKIPRVPSCSNRIEFRWLLYGMSYLKKTITI